MLQRIRDGLQKQKWVAILVLGALILVFAAWGAYGIVDVGIGSAQYAAKVDGEKVGLKEAQEAWQQQQIQWQQRFGGELPADIKSRLQDQLLEGMVREALLAKHSHDLGYRVSDTQLHEEIRRLPAFQLEGKYSPDAARYALAQAGLSLPAFEATLRRELQRAQIENGIRVSDFVSPVELARLQALQGEQREVRYVTLTPEKYSAAVNVNDAAVEAYYKANQPRFMTTESVQLAYAELRLDQLASEVTVTDDELKAAYDKNKDKYIQPEKRHVRHILIEPGKDDAAAQKQVQALLAEAKSGKDFGELAKKNSQDTGSAPSGGDLGWIERANFDPAFIDAAFSMAAGEVRGPVKSKFGYHLIKVEEIQAAKGRSFEEARGEIEAQVRKDKASDKFGDLQEKLQQKLEQPGADLDALAKEFSLQTGEVAQFLKGEGGAPLGNSPELQEAAFSTAVLDEHRLGGPVAVGEDRLVLVKALKHEKPTPKPLAAVHDEIVAALRKEKGNEAAVKAADLARVKLEAGTSFDDVAKELAITAEPAHFIGRDDPSVPVPVRDLVFKSPKPVGGKPVFRSLPLEAGGAVFLAVTGVRAEPSPNPELQARAKREASQRHGQGDAAAYMDELRRTADVSKNPKAFE
ncbi:MAG: SurA N-terminal domain-containing protein [Gammaproteobacteria bacterium]